MSLPLQQIKPRNARSKRALEKRQPQVHENAKRILYVRGEKCSQILQLCLRDLRSLTAPFAIKFNKKNAIRPFEDASSFEFFSLKNDASLIVFGTHSKKRPHCLTLARLFGHQMLDMLELYVDPETMRTIGQFRGDKVSVGLKPMIAFSGSAWDSPSDNHAGYRMAKSLLLDLFRGQEAQSVDAEGLQMLMQFSVGEDVEGLPPPKIHMRVYKIRTARSGQKTPRVEVDEMGPRVDFSIGRLREPDEAMMREALKKPRLLEPKVKKNIDTDAMGDKVGRIHVGKQNLAQLQTRKMKGLKRGHDEMGDHEMVSADDASDGGAPLKRAR